MVVITLQSKAQHLFLVACLRNQQVSPYLPNSFCAYAQQNISDDLLSSTISWQLNRIIITLAVMSKELTKNTTKVGSMTLISRIVGFIRDVIIARVFGAGLETDAFIVAFKLPNFLRRLFAEGAFTQAFIPVLAEYKAEHSEDEEKQFIRSIAGNLALVLILLSIVAILAAPIVIMIFAPGFIENTEKYQLASQLLKITFPYIILISLTSLAAGVLNSYGYFSPPAFVPTLLNIALITCAIYLSPHLAQPIVGLAIGVLIGGILQLFFLIPWMMKIERLAFPKPSWEHSGVRKVMRLMLPAIFGVSVAQINLLVDTLIASFLISGSVTWLYYSERLMDFPLGVFGVALSTVILPKLSSCFKEQQMQKFSQTLVWSSNCVIVIGLPAAVGLLMLADPILIALFQYGEFKLSDVTQTQKSLIAYSIGLLGFIYIKILATGYFSRHDTKTPVKYAAIALVCNIVLNVILVFPFAHAGLALATSLSAFINALLLFKGLQKAEVYQTQGGWQILLLRALIATLAMIACLLLLKPEESLWVGWHWTQRGFTLGGLVLAGAATYFATLYLVGLRPKHLTQHA